MPITFNSAGGFFNGTISSSNGDVFITTSGSAGSIHIGNQELTGSQIIEKDASGKVRNKKTFNTDGTITQEKFDANAKIVETKIKNPKKKQIEIAEDCNTYQTKVSKYLNLFKLTLNEIKSERKQMAA